MKKKALVVLAEGFEETEAVTPIDILRRAGVEVTVAGLGGMIIKGSRGVFVKADKELSRSEPAPDALVLPGGGMGAKNLAASGLVTDMIRSCQEKKKVIAAICAAPSVVLAPLGVLDGKKAVCYPGDERTFGPLVKFINEPVVQDGNVITSKGVGTALAFSLKIAEALTGKDTADKVAKEVVYAD